MDNKKESVIVQIENMISDVPGFTPVDQLLSLFTLTLASANLPGDILEVGSWCGRSAVVFGLSAKLSKKSKVYCVDLFPEKSDWYQNVDGTYSFAVTIDSEKFGAYGDQTVWAEPFLRDIAPIYQRYSGSLQAFQDSVSQSKLEDYVVPYKGTLNHFAAQADKDFQCRLAFIDGDHSYKAVCDDIAIVEKFLVSGGWICFDDAFSAYEGVDRAIKEKIIDNPMYRDAQQLTRKLFVARRV